MNTNDDQSLRVAEPSVSKLSQDNFVEIGSWYWVNEDGDPEWLGCAMEMGSNYVVIQAPRDERGYVSARIHLKEAFNKLRHEPNVDFVIQQKVAHYQSLAQKHMADVRTLTARLGVSNQLRISNTPADETGSALVAISGESNVTEYKNNLIRAKDEELPVLFKLIKEANSKVAKWMSAQTLPMAAQAGLFKSTIGDIENRVFNIGLYAGLLEHVVQCTDGEPAPFHEKLHVMQRLLYMDEECLLNYRVGGMEFDDIDAFDAWLAQPDNLNRVLPFPRCMVAMRVRRNTKQRNSFGNIGIMLQNIERAHSDKWTFLYIRNGERLYRLGSDSFEFDGATDMIFPDKSGHDLSSPMMVKSGFFDRNEMITVSDFEARCQEEAERKQNFDQWRKDHPLETWEGYDSEADLDKRKHIALLWKWANPYDKDRAGNRFNPDEWSPFNDDYLYFDECMRDIENRLKKYNRIALLIQGIFDRSELLHPHPPVRIWIPESFSSAVELVYDGSISLYGTEKPDIDAYIADCNASLHQGSVVIGQELYWMEKEAEKECRRMDKNWRYSDAHRPETYAPPGNPGPGYLAKIARMKKHSAVFAWNRERQGSDYFNDKHYGDPIRTTIEVPISRLFNVSAYKPGDFKRFFLDPRTRAEYLKWAPMLIAAEEFCAGNTKVADPAV